MHPRRLTMYHIFFQNGSTNVMSWCADCESTPLDEKSRLTRFLATCCSAHFILNNKPFNINADLACAAEHNQEAYEKKLLKTIQVRVQHQQRFGSRDRQTAAKNSCTNY